LQTNKALVIGREGQRKETITSSPPPIVGCDRTVIDGLSPLRASTALTVIRIGLRKFSPPPK
jgi:hypothetical protein